MTREKGSEESVHKCQRKTENFQVTTLAQLSFRNSGNVEMRPSENIFSRETEACIPPNSLFFDCFTISLLCSASTVNRLKNFSLFCNSLISLLHFSDFSFAFLRFLFCISLIPADEAVSREVCVQLGSDRDVDQHKHGADQPQVYHL